MKYRVVAYYVSNHHVDDECICDSYPEACDLAINWQYYYDNDWPFYESDEIIVCIEDLND